MLLFCLLRGWTRGRPVDHSHGASSVPDEEGSHPDTTAHFLLAKSKAENTKKKDTRVPTWPLSRAKTTGPSPPTPPSPKGAERTPDPSPGLPCCRAGSRGSASARGTGSAARDERRRPFFSFLIRKYGQALRRERVKEGEEPRRGRRDGVGGLDGRPANKG